MPAFEPSKIGPNVSGGERQEILRFVEHSLPEIIRSTAYYMQAIERGARTRIRITRSSDDCWIADFSSGSCCIFRSESEKFDDSIWIAASTFLRPIHAEIPLGHTWGCWMGNSPIIDAVFSDPRYYISYAEKLLAQPSGISRYGL
jgi:hypothetical protein